MAIKVGMVSLGCSKNQVDGEIMLSLIRESGFELCGDASQCEVVIINTCGFIEDAKRESVENILEFCELKGKSKIKVVVVTGCLAERYRNEVALEIPEADVVLGIGRNGDIVSAIKRAIAGEKVIEFAGKAELSLEGDRVLVNDPFFAYVKVADGCDNRCSYCAIPNIRGNFRSRKLEDILTEIKRLASRGVKEVNIVAQDTTRYGEDIYGKLMLPELLKETCKIDGIEWVRVLYCYPERITDELLEVMATEPKIVRYMDMPIQHSNGKILKAMNRRGDSKALLELTEKIRAKMPDIALRTTIITGFPGETEEEFEELCDFVKEAKFDRLGCFAYSREEDTPAYDMENQIDEEIKQKRAGTIMTEQMRIATELSKKHIGETIKVLTEGYDEENDLYYGRSYKDAPDIDTKVLFYPADSDAEKTLSGEDYKAGEFVDVTIVDTAEYDLVGEVR